MAFFLVFPGVFSGALRGDHVWRPGFVPVVVAD